MGGAEGTKLDEDFNEMERVWQIDPIFSNRKTKKKVEKKIISMFDHWFVFRKPM